MDGAAWQISSELSGEPSELDVRESERPADCDGDGTRLRRAFERCGEDLYRFIVLRVRGDGHAADDLLQQTCYEAARHRRMPVDDNAAQAWLFGIAKNVIRRHFRHLRREGHLAVHETAAGADSRVSPGDENEPATAGQGDAAPHLLAAIAKLSEADQVLLLGSYFEGRSHEELARTFGISVRAIEGRLYRARNALRQALSIKLGEDNS